MTTPAVDHEPPSPSRWAGPVRPLAVVAVVGVAVLGLAVAIDAPPDEVSTDTIDRPSSQPATTAGTIGTVDVLSVDDAVPELRPGADAAPPGSSAPPVSGSVPPTAPPQDDEAPAVVARPVPSAAPAQPPPPAPPPSWAASRTVTPAGHVSTDLGCAAGLDAGAIDRYLAQRLGPVLGWDYQHIVALGGDRYLWLFQDTFVDHTGAATTLDQSSFVHNAAMVQTGRCFRLLHRGTPERPDVFERGTGSATLTAWFWPKGGELIDGVVYVHWVKMVKDAFDPQPPDGLGWHPTETWLATYDPVTLARNSFRPATNFGVAPVYGYAMQSDARHTFLFGNTFEQNLTREGGFWNGPHSATRMYLARVPRGRFAGPIEYRTADGWSTAAAAAEPILQRHYVEFPMQPRRIDGQWVAATAVNGYWGDELEIDVANDPWGPWTTVRSGPLLPRGFDPLRNTYHAHLAPWRDGGGRLVVTVSNNARDMLAHAWPNPSMYRPIAFSSPWVPAPPRPAPSTTVPVTTTTVTPTTTAAPTTTSTVPAETTTTSTVPAETTTTSTVPAETTTTSTAPVTTATTTTTAATTTAPAAPTTSTP